MDRGKQILCQKISRDKRTNKKEATKLFNECEFAILNGRQVLLDSAKHLLRGILLESSNLHAEIVKLGDFEKIQESKKWLNEISEQGQFWLERGINDRTAEMSEAETIITELEKKSLKNSKIEKGSVKSMPTKMGSGNFGIGQKFRTVSKNFSVDHRRNKKSEKITEIVDSKKSEITYREDVSVNSSLTQINLEKHNFGAQKSEKSISEIVDWKQKIRSLDDERSIRHKKTDSREHAREMRDQFEKYVNLDYKPSSNEVHAQFQKIKPIELKVFSGDEETFPTFLASFMAIIDKAPYDPTYKLLQLRQYLAGEAFKCVEPLGFSETAYTVALQRLKRKYGGERRQAAIFMEKVENFKIIKDNNPDDLEKFADFLDSLIVNLKDTNKAEELGSGLLYMKLQQKLPPTFLAKYYRWTFDNRKAENVESLRSYVVQESEFLTMAFESTDGISKGNSQKTFFMKNKNVILDQCRVCNQKHTVETCNTFKTSNVQERWETSKKLGLCFKCLVPSHIANECSVNKKCGIDKCHLDHHPLLHQNKKVLDTPKMLKEEKTAYFSEKLSLLSQIPNRVSMRTIPVVLQKNGKEVTINALMDDGSTQSFLNQDIAEYLGIEDKQFKEMNISMLNGAKDQLKTQQIGFKIQNMITKKTFEMTACTTSDVCGNLQSVDWNHHKQKFTHLSEIPFNTPVNQGKVDLLIGLDYANLHTSMSEVIGQTGQPVARLTPLGWTCIGKINDSDESIENSHFVNVFFAKGKNDFLDIQKSLSRFWEIEEFDISKQNLSVVDKEIVKNCEENIKTPKNIGEPFEIPTPWKLEKDQLTLNTNQAMVRLHSTEKQLRKKPEVATVYKKTIENYENKGYIREVHDQETKWLLPHFPVIKPERSTTKVRIVFDASVKNKGLSLNDCIFQGPKLQNDLFKVLVRFRKGKIGLSCDISEMYLQVAIPEEDRQYFRFLWRNLDDRIEPKTYEFNRVVFGVTCSPFQAQFVSRYNARIHEEELKLAADSVIKSTYIDDVIDSVDSEEEGVQLCCELKELWSRANMTAHKFASNSQKVLEQVPLEKRAVEVDINGDLPQTKTLGILWDSQADVFQFKVKEFSGIFTKREFLKFVASVFDPLGFLAPVNFRAKVLIQEMWTRNLDWDEEFSEDIKTEVEKWCNELKLIEQVMIERCFRAEKGKIHIFTDASPLGYAAIAYCISGENKNCEAKLIACKTKVAPLTSTSIPRLELLSAELGVKLAQSISDALKVELSKITLWTDSADVLGWLSNRSRIFRPFVANRLGRIQDLINISQWCYIESEKNPADIPSRGQSMTDFLENKLWFSRPGYFQQKRYINGKICESLKEVKANVENIFLSVNNERSWVLEVEHFSDLTRLMRCRAWVHRFLNNCRIHEKRKGELTKGEIEGVFFDLIREAQARNFSEDILALSDKRPIEKKSLISALNPFLDADGILRSNSRIQYAETLNYDTKFPILLPKKDALTRLIIKDQHEKEHHVGGTNATLAALSSRFWINSAREEIRRWENLCNQCKKNKAKIVTQLMSSLPKYRLGKSLRAFSKIGVDYAGPFLTKQGRGRVRQKRWLCLFTCLEIRAVHLEIAYGLDTYSFLNAFFRMTSRRGFPSLVVSDNGTNFVKGNKELNKLVDELDRNKIVEKTSSKGIEWKFNPPSAPHFGGVFEIMIKAAKRAMNAQIKLAEINDEELLTVVASVEHLINSRPLTYQTSNENDIIPLTPNHFLHGLVGDNFAPEIDNTETLLGRWKRLQEIIKSFWKRFMREWVPNQVPRKKWQQLRSNIKIGDVVLVVDPDTIRGKWPLGRVTTTFPSRDNRIRKVEVLIGGKRYVRPISRICLLKIQ